MRLLLILVVVALAACAAPARGAETDLDRWEQQAQAVTIIRDDWGIPHVRGRTDADAVFGVVYAQAEDDFNRIETNYLTMIGRLAEAEGESALYSDLRARLYVDPAEMQRRYAASPSWLKALMEAWADGLERTVIDRFDLHTPPEDAPRAAEPYARCRTQRDRRTCSDRIRPDHRKARPRTRSSPRHS